MNARSQGTVSLITPSYRGDYERSGLLFESVDRYVTSFEKHYVIVHDEDFALFRKFHTGRRVVMRASELLPVWLREIPLIRWRRRQYWWSFRAKPVSGWHTQQLVKIKAAASLPEDRFCLIDADNIFFRAFDVAAFAPPHAPVLRFDRNGADRHIPTHMVWTQAARRLLGMSQPTFPTDDFIDQIIVWDKQIVQTMISRIEKTVGCEWAEALCREHDFSEYMIYGNFVTGDDELRARTTLLPESFCRTHWNSHVLRSSDIVEMLETSSARQVALCIQSFNTTPLTEIQAGINQFKTSRSDAAA
jgi:hypothetical protein